VYDGLLRSYAEERNAFHASLLESLNRDGDVVAAWRWGSFGTPRADELSDLDLWIVVPDGYLAKHQSGPLPQASLARRPLLLLDVPRNYPIDGRYLLTLYEGEIGPHQVDWYWQEESAAVAPPEATLVVERRPIPRSTRPPSFPGGQPSESATAQEGLGRQVTFFFAMVPAVAKQVARQPGQQDWPLAEVLLSSLSEVADTSGISINSIPRAGEWRGSDPNGKLEVLESCVRSMGLIWSEVEQRELEVPDSSVVQQCQRFIELAKVKLRQQSETTNGFRT
jgi:predicted nucleotidyltransferase